MDQALIIRYLLLCLLFTVMTVGSSRLFAESAGSTPKDAEIDTDFDMVINRDISYVPAKIDKSTHKLQTLDIYHGQHASGVPVVLYIHGGGWAFGDKADVHVKPHFFTRNGFGFVSMNYRLRWDYKIYDQLTDVVSAIDWLQRDGEQYGLDGSRIILMGHAAGGHLASLVATDRSFLRAEDIDPSIIRAIVSVDSHSYDIELLMNDLGNFVERRQHELIFTDDVEVWRAASPITHARKNETLPPFALLFNPEREVSSQQARKFAKELQQAKAQVIMIPGSEVDPDKTDELLGTAGHIPTGALMAFLRSQI